LTIRNSKLTLTNCLHNQLVCDSSMCKHCVCLWSEKTTVCRIFNCQRLVGGQAPEPPDSLTRGAPKPRSVRSSGSALATLKSRASVYVGARLGALVGRSLRFRASASQAALTASLTPATTNLRSRRRLQRTRRPCCAPKLFFQITSD